MSDVHIALYLSRLRVEEMSRRATFLESLGPAPESGVLPRFQRRVVHLPGVVEVRRGGGPVRRSERRAA